MVSSPAKQPGAHPNMGSCPAESSEPITNRTGMQTKLPYLSRSNINASLAGLPLSSFKAVKQLQRAQRGIASPLAELPLNSTENEKHNHSLQEAGLNILLQQTPPASALPGPEIVDSPCLPEATENTPIPYIKSRAAHFGNPHPRGSIICWATADSNPAFGLPDSPTGSEESTSTFSTPLSMKSNCYRSQTPISPMHGPDRDCGKCKRSTEEEVSSCIISSSQIDFQNLCSTRSAFQCDCIASEDGMQDRKYDKLSPVMTDSSKEGCHSEHENQPASSAPSLKLLASLGLVQFAVRADKV